MNSFRGLTREEWQQQWSKERKVRRVAFAYHVNFQPYPGPGSGAHPLVLATSQPIGAPMGYSRDLYQLRCQRPHLANRMRFYRSRYQRKLAELREYEELFGADHYYVESLRKSLPREPEFWVKQVDQEIASHPKVIAGPVGQLP